MPNKYFVAFNIDYFKLASIITIIYIIESQVITLLHSKSVGSICAQ